MKKTKIKFVLMFFLIVILLLIIVFFVIICRPTETNKDYEVINDIDYSKIETLDVPLYSKSYLLIRLNDYKALYGKNYEDVIYPASLTKILTMDTCANRFSDLNDVSYFTYDQYNSLIEQNASIAGIVPFKEYSLKDLFYYLVLPSGADAAYSISNYFENNNLNLVDEMNKRCLELDLTNSHFTNPTGLHNEEMYSTLKDLSIIYIDALKNDYSKNVLKTTYSYEYNLYSTIYSLAQRDDNVIVYGGKTGFTDEAHQNIIVFYEVNNRSYILLLAGADGNPGENEYYHIDDVNNIFDYLYK